MDSEANGNVHNAREQQFLRAMRRMASTVSIISCARAGQRYCMTATSVISVSLDPCSVCVCVNRSARIHGPLSLGAPFYVNILHSSQQTLSSLCSEGEDGDVRFDGHEWCYDDEGRPYVCSAQANLLCTPEKHCDYASHTLFIGNAVSIRVREEISPLLYLDGTYGTGRS